MVEPADNHSEESSDKPTGVPSPDAPVMSTGDGDTNKKKSYKEVLGVSLGRVGVFAVVFLSACFTFPSVRALMSSSLSGLKDGSMSSFEMPLEVTTADNVQMRVVGQAFDMCKFRIYKRTPDLVKGKIIDRARFDLSEEPTVKVRMVTLDGQTPLLELAAPVEWYDFLEGKCQTALPKLPPGDYLCEAVAFKGGKSISSRIRCLRVSNLGLIVRQFHTKVLVKTFDLCTLKPVSTTVNVMHIESEQDDSNSRWNQPVKPMAKVASVQTGADGCGVLNMQLLESGGDAFSNVHDVAFSAMSGENRVWQCDQSFPSTYEWVSRTSAYLQYATNGVNGSSSGSIVDIISDRPVYRLGQTVYFKGYVRDVLDNGLVNNARGKSCEITITNPQGQQIQMSKVRMGDFGDFGGSFKIAQEGQTGSYNISISVPELNQSSSKSIEVLQYRKPEYEVSVVPEKIATIAGEKLKVKIKATYFFGAPVVNANVSYTVSSTPNYQIRGQLRDVPDYYSFFGSASSHNVIYSDPGAPHNGTAVTDKNGEAEVVIDTEANKQPSSPFDASSIEKDFNFSVDVTDLSRKTAQGSGSALVTSGDYVVILESSRSVLKPGEKFISKVKALDYDNKPVKNKPVVLSLEEWTYEKDKYVKKKVLLTRTINTDDHGNGNAEIEFPPETPGGRYYLFATGTDGGGRVICDSTYVWFTAPGMSNEMDDDSPEVTIDLDKPVYKPGETIRAVVKSPTTSFGRSAALVTVSGYTLHEFQNIALNSKTTLVEIPAKAIYAPEANIQLTAVNEKRQTKVATTDLKIYPEPFLLTVEVAPGKKEYGPSENAALDFIVKKSDGSPAANTELVVSTVDESLYAVKPDDHDIRQVFYGNRGTMPTETSFSFQELPVFTEISMAPVSIAWLFPSKSRMYSEVECLKCASEAAPSVAYDSAVGGGAPMLQGATNGTIGPQGADATVIRSVPAPSPAPSRAKKARMKSAKPHSGFAKVALVRSDFRDSAFWSGSIKTDAKGHATAKFKLPDNLTTWRVTASAASQSNEFGEGKGSFRVNKEILARLSLPRFFTMDDEGFVTGIVHNYSRKNQTIRMELNASSQFTVGKPVQQEVSVAPEGVAEFRWPVTLTGEGNGKIELKAAGQSDADALREELPVRPFSYPAFACKNGILKDDALVTSLPLKLTPDARPGSGNFRFSVASSAIGPVLGNFDTLIEYPYGCTEQTMSRMMPSVVAMELHKKLDLPLNADTLKLYKDVQRKCFIQLVQYQAEDGGWSWWGGDHSVPYLTAYVMEGLYLLKQAGFTVDQSMIDSGKARLFQMVSESKAPWEREDATDQAYVAYVASLWGNKLLARNASKHLENSLRLGPEGLSYLTMAFKRSGEDRAAKAVYDQLISLANKNWEYTNWEHTSEMLEKLGDRKALDYTYRFTGVESSALAMQAVLSMEPQNEKLLTSIRRWILFQRDLNGWNNTKTTARVFLALLDDEIAARAGKPTNFTASALVNGKTLANFVFNKANQYSTEQLLEFRLKGNESEMAIKKFGTGRLYYSSLLTYQRKIVPGKTVVPRSSPPDLSVTRHFFRLEQYTDEKTKVSGTRAVAIPKEGVQAGETILMRLEIDSPATFPYVMVDAALPSGAEVQSDTPGSVGNVSSYETAGSPFDACNFNYWWTHQDVLDDRIVFFANEIPSGKSTFQALLRMEMPGKFNVNPVTFEGMYTKAIRGYSDADQIVVHE